MGEDIINQASQVARSAEEMARDKDVYLYVTAMDRGDLDMMGEIMERAESDPLLFQAIEEVHAAMVKEENIVIPPEFVERATKMIKHIIRQYEERW
jgi:hypothetical protein